MRNINMPSKKAQGGFTLAELAVVVIVIGIIAAIIIPRFTGSGAAKSRAQAIMTFADSGSTIIRSSISQMGTGFSTQGSAVTSNSIVAGSDWLDVLVYGKKDEAGADFIKPTFQGRFDLTGAGTLEAALSSIDTAGASAGKGEYRIQDYPVTLIDDNTTVDASRTNTDAGNFPVCAGMADKPRTAYFRFSNVSRDIVMALAIGYEDPDLIPDDLDAGQALDDSSGLPNPPKTVAWTAADANDLRTVCIAKSLK